MIYFTSDTHFCHNQEFIYRSRGFFSIGEHDKTIIENWNKIVSKNDIVYHLGDVMLNDNEKGLKYLKSLNGEIHIIRGNHCSNARVALYNTLPNVVEVCEAKTIKIGKQYYFLCHYPTFTANYDDKPYQAHLINLFGHTHSKEKFYNPTSSSTDLNPFMYNVALDAHNCYPISIEQINKDIINKIKELQLKEYYNN